MGVRYERDEVIVMTDRFGSLADDGPATARQRARRQRVRQLSGGNVVGLCGEDSPQRDDALGVQTSVSTAFSWTWFACAQHACHHPTSSTP